MVAEVAFDEEPIARNQLWVKKFSVVISKSKNLQLGKPYTQVNNIPGCSGN